LPHPHGKTSAVPAKHRAVSFSPDQASAITAAGICAQ
jgi:hypothetical protein